MPADSERPLYKILSTKTIWWASGLILAVAAAVTTWLLLAFGYQLEAIKTASTIVLGTGGAAALLLAARRQRSTELALNQKDRDLAHQERDAIERRITDLYTKAADQLGSDKAPVRLAGLYALERVAQDNPAQRQTIVNLWCAYLRMPFQPPDDEANPDHRERLQEREVRRTAQRLLADHLGPGALTFWANITLDLTGATLIDFSLQHCVVHAVSFRSATFTGRTDFEATTFAADTDFMQAKFSGSATFKAATFKGEARFHTASFAGVTFSNTHFVGHANFTRTQFGGDTSFAEAAFQASANFGMIFSEEKAGATFEGLAYFLNAVFNGTVYFGAVTFEGDAYFRGAVFHGSTDFGDGWTLEPVTFEGKTNFQGARFGKGVPEQVSKYWSPPLPDFAEGASDEPA